MLGRFGVGPHKSEERVSGVGRRSPDLLAVEDKLISIPSCFGLQGGQVRARSGFGIALRPRDFGCEYGRQIPPPLILGTVGDKRWTEHAE